MGRTRVYIIRGGFGILDPEILGIFKIPIPGIFSKNPEIPGIGMENSRDPEKIPKKSHLWYIILFFKCTFAEN